MRHPYIALLDRAFSCTEKCRKIFALPAREGGLGIHDISDPSNKEYQFTRRATERLAEAIYRRLGTAPIDLYQVKAEITGERLAFHKEKRVEIGRELNDMEKLQLDLAAEKGASSWLTSLPLKSFGYILNKQEFTKAICLWYNLKIKDTAKLCVCVCVCFSSEITTLNHSLICKKGGYFRMRNNSLVPLITKLLVSTGQDAGMWLQSRYFYQQQD